MSSQTPQKGTITKIPVWDILVRIFHWSLVTSFVICYFTQEENYELHLIAGYTVAGLVIFRIFWGLAGTRYARFTNFVRSPKAVVEYMRSIKNRAPNSFTGHNPLGGYMVIAILLDMIVITFSGVALDAAENRAGPLADTTMFYYTSQIQTTHNLSTDIVVILIVLHLLGVIFSSFLHKENLVKTMITGYKVSSGNN